jgi:hypothetical protein
MDPEEETVLAKRRRDAERKRLQRAAYSQEKKDEISKKEKRSQLGRKKESIWQLSMPI